MSKAVFCTSSTHRNIQNLAIFLYMMHISILAPYWYTYNFDFSFSIKNIYWKIIYVYCYENIFQDESIDIIFTFPNSTT
jgi:hypothetical protein